MRLPVTRLTMVSATSILATLFALLTTCAMGESTSETRGDRQSTDELLDQLFRAEEFSELYQQPGLWRSELSPEERKSLVVALIPHLWSQQSLRLALPAGTVIEPRYDWSKGIPPEVQQADRRIRHDLSMAAGRATWAIEELLLCSLPVVYWKGVEEDERSEAIARACQGIVAAMDVPLVDGTERAPVEQRLAAAQSEDSPPRLLAELANDSSAEVRAAVAANIRTPLETVRKLESDPVAAVRAAASENARRARSLLRDPE